MGFLSEFIYLFILIVGGYVDLFPFLSFCCCYWRVGSWNLGPAGCSWDHGQTRAVFVRSVSELNAIELNAVLTFFENNSLLAFCLETRVSFAPLSLLP